MFLRTGLPLVVLTAYVFVFPVSPAVTVTPVGPVKVKVGEPITLECQAAGEPRPSVSWHKLDNNRKTTLTSPVPMESNALLQVLLKAALLQNPRFSHLKPAHLIPDFGRTSGGHRHLRVHRSKL